MKITSEEIAKLANVSRSTVSRVINNYSNVPEETRRKVMEVIEKYEYEPHSSARVLAGKANKVIVLCISDYMEGKRRWRGTESPYFMRLIAELVSQTNLYGYIISVFILASESDYGKLENMFLNREVTAGIFVGFEFDFQMEHINRLIRKGFSMAVIDPGAGMAEAGNVTGIYSENEQAGYLATSYLIRQGHRRVAHLAGDKRMSSRHRADGYMRAMKEAGIPDEGIRIGNGNFESERAYQLSAGLIAEGAVSAIFAANDLMAISALRAARDLDRQVPRDIAIVGCDYLPLYDEVGFHLTSVTISLGMLAQRAVKAALGMESERVVWCRAELRPGSTA